MDYLSRLVLARAGGSENAEIEVYDPRGKDPETAVPVNWKVEIEDCRAKLEKIVRDVALNINFVAGFTPKAQDEFQNFFREGVDLVNRLHELDPQVTTKYGVAAGSLFYHIVRFHELLGFAGERREQMLQYATSAVSFDQSNPEYAKLLRKFKDQAAAPKPADAGSYGSLSPANPPVRGVSRDSGSGIPTASGSRDLIRTEPTAAPTFSPAPPGKMQLKVKRSQRTGVFNKIIYIVDARMHISQQDWDMIQKHGLTSSVIYDSKSRQRHLDATKEHLGNSREAAAWNASAADHVLSLGKTLFKLGSAGVRLGMAAVSLRITVESLFRGVHIECKSLEELLEAEEAIMKAGENLRAYLDTVATFDGREQVFEF